MSYTIFVKYMTSGYELQLGLSYPRANGLTNQMLKKKKVKYKI